MAEDMEIEDHLLAAEKLVEQMERGEMRLAEAIQAFRKACEHLGESEQLLVAARLEVRRLVADQNGEPSTEPF